NGPIAARLGVAGGPNALGNGHRANAVIGRAVRLVLQNVGGARPGREDRATLGHPGKFSYCLAENEAQSPWEPLHVERGFPRDASTVTVCGSEGPHNVNDHGSMAAETLMAAIAGTAATTGSNNIYLAGDPLVMLGPEHAQTTAASGWSKAEVKPPFWGAARVPAGLGGAGGAVALGLALAAVEDDADLRVAGELVGEVVEEVHVRAGHDHEVAQGFQLRLGRLEPRAHAHVGEQHDRAGQVILGVAEVAEPALE